jgi:hypothetical protein
MNTLHTTRWWTCFVFLTTGMMIGLNQPIAAQQPMSADQAGLEVLTRGPVHEAFAETITFDPEPGVLVSNSPPEAIEEVPPDQRPAGANVAWIPGYWGWDDERNDYLWISGIWRALPPGRQWVPGYWAKSPQGYQWTSGYWADAQANDRQYLPEPPATVEVGPNVAAPSVDDIWLPGCWIWQQNRYAWRPGTWSQGHRDWDWVPDHYVWTPSGYVFVDGYYDYSVPRRGVVFAPVYFDQSLRTRRGFSYSPTTVINPGVFSSHLFLRPGYGHYYFGDYYGTSYANTGFSPFYSFQSSRRGYDPIYASQRWQNRRDRGWEQRAQAHYRNLHDNENARPPRNWAAQRELVGNRDGSDRPNRMNAAVVEPLDEFNRRQDNQVRFQPVDPTERQQFGQRGQEYRKYLQQRQQLEANAAATAGGAPANLNSPARRTFSRSPIVAAPVEQLGKDYAPPQRHEVLKPDFQVQPQPRNRGRMPAANPAVDQRPTGQFQVDPRRQQQRQGANQGNRQDALGRQSQGGGSQRGSGQQQAPSQGESGASNNRKRGASSAPTQGATNSQGQAPPQTTPADKAE